MPFFAQQTLNALQLGSIYALIALGYTMVYGMLRMINFAHGDISWSAPSSPSSARPSCSSPSSPTLLFSMAARRCWA